MDRENLIRHAMSARENSYSPYSRFRVGAALLCGDGKVYEGCNIENRAYAFFKAVSEGKREFSAIAIVGGKEEMTWCYPCGVCRQVMAEFCDPDAFEVICAKSPEEYKVFTLEELLPHMF